MNYRDFLRLVMDATECETFEAYMAEVGGTAPYTMQAGKLDGLLAACWTYGRSRTALTVRKMANMSQTAFARAYGLPRRSVENWESDGANARTAPPYVIDLLAYAVFMSEE